MGGVDVMQVTEVGGGGEGEDSKQAAHLGHSSWAQHQPSWEGSGDESVSWCRQYPTVFLVGIRWSMSTGGVVVMSGGGGRGDEGQGKKLPRNVT